MADARISILEVCLLLCWVAVCCTQKNVGDRCTDSLQRDGVCYLLIDCPVVMEKFFLYNISTLCGTSDSLPIVCCPNQPLNLPTTPVNPLHLPKPPLPFTEIKNHPESRHGFRVRPEPVVADSPPLNAPPSKSHLPMLPGVRAKYWCEEYRKLCSFESSEGPYVKAVGGEPVKYREYPHMAAIGYGRKDDIKWNCGGSLISENFVLTAAHCIRSGRIGCAKWVLLGTEYLAANESLLRTEGQIHKVVRRHRHDEYKSRESYNDIALLEIGPAITRNSRSLLSKELHPACLMTEDHMTPKYVATGWGRVEHRGRGSDNLLKVKIDAIAKTTCNKTFEKEIHTNGRLSRGVDSTMICAGILRGGRDTCEGDSGGPLHPLTSGSCIYDVAGITSFGKICGSRNSPSIYTKISAFIEWIENHVWPLGTNKVI